MSANERDAHEAGPSVRVGEFYGLLADGRGDEVARFVAANFADNATLSRPDSLPGGGVLAGADRIGKFMRLAASGVAGVSLRSVHETQSSDGVSVFAEVAINLGGVDTTAIEWWTFSSEGVTSLRAYYWDTAAILAAARR
jgi:hypothetical protein